MRVWPGLVGLLIAAPVMAADLAPALTDQEKLDAAYAKLHAKHAATGPAPSSGPSEAPKAAAAGAGAPNAPGMINPENYDVVVRDLLIRGEKQRPARLLELHKWHELAQAAFQHLEARNDSKAMDARVYLMKIRAEEARLSKPYTYIPLIESLDVGQVGRMPGKTWRDVHDDNAIVILRDLGEVWANHFDLKNVVSDQAVDLPPFQVTGVTHGSRRVKQIEPVQMPAELQEMVASNREEVSAPTLQDPGPLTRPPQVEYHRTIPVR